MPVYAPVTGFADQRRHPRALLLIVGAHAVLIGAVMTAKMAVPIIESEGPIIVDWIPTPVDPPPNPEPPKAESKTRTDPPTSHVDRPDPVLPIQNDKGPVMDTDPISIDSGPIA